MSGYDLNEAKALVDLYGKWKSAAGIFLRRRRWKPDRSGLYREDAFWTHPFHDGVISMDDAVWMELQKHRKKKHAN